MQFEDEAGVVVEIAGKACREGDAADIDTARGEEAGALVESVERGGEVEPGLAGELAQGGRGAVRIAASTIAWLQVTFSVMP